MTPSNFSRNSRVAASLLTLLTASRIASAADLAAADAARLVSPDYRHLLIRQLSVADDKAAGWTATLQAAPPRQRDALAFLLANMPEGDLKTLAPDRLLREVALAYEARDATRWAGAVPEDVFLNDVVPYANTSEARDPWREDFRRRFAPLVADCRSTSDAVQVLNSVVFKQLGVAYHATKRQKPDQSPAESIRIGYASCTGLSILLVDACRSVGVPARLAGTPMWSDDSGNHTWVEVWDGHWHYVGAAEPSPLDDTWFTPKAAKADAGRPQYAIWAASFARTPTPFPAVWAAGRIDLYGENVTARYAAPAAGPATAPAADAALAASDDDPTVKALRDYLSVPLSRRRAWTDLAFVDRPLTKPQAIAAKQLLLADAAAELRAERAAEWQARSLALDGQTMRLFTTTIGMRPAAGWDLYISLHGGGNAPATVNDQQWQNQQILYSPVNSLYIAPRAPTNDWDLWHEPHIDAMLGRLIEDAIVLGGANPERVYLMGYSAGGDGVYQLAPRMADRFAAAAMMAGHPNDASPLGLRNLPFTIHVGALDNGFDRNKVALDWNAKLDVLQAGDPGGYVHSVQLHEGRSHWMNREDAVALPWMSQYSRDPIPMCVVWVQGRATHDRFYWLANPDAAVKAGALIEARRDGQTIHILRAQGVTRLDVLLNDAMLDLDRPVVVCQGEHVLFDGVVPRTASAIRQALQGRYDPAAVFCAKLSIDLDAQATAPTSRPVRRPHRDD